MVNRTGSINGDSIHVYLNIKSGGFVIAKERLMLGVKLFQVVLGS